MILDKFLMFDEAAVLTATRNSTNVIDLLRIGEDIGRGEPLYWFFTVTTVLDSAGEAATLQVALVTDDNTGLTTPAILQDNPIVITEAILSQTGGYNQFRYVPPTPPPVMERYLGVVYTVGTENFVTGNISCGITHDIQLWKAYASNFVSA